MYVSLPIIVNASSKVPSYENCPVTASNCQLYAGMKMFRETLTFRETSRKIIFMFPLLSVHIGLRRI